MARARKYDVKLSVTKPVFKAIAKAIGDSRATDIFDTVDLTQANIREMNDAFWHVFREYKRLFNKGVWE